MDTIRFVIALLIFIFSFPSYADSKQNMMQAVSPKVEYALSCHAKWGAISDVVTTNLVVENDKIIVQGHYHQSLITFNQVSGVFTALFDSDINLVKMKYTVSFKKGLVKDECLNHGL